MTIEKKSPANHSRNADKFVIRLKDGQRDEIKARADEENQTMNSFIVTAIEQKLSQSKAFSSLLDLVEKAIQPSGGAFVTIKREYLRELVDYSSIDMPMSAPAIVAAMAVLGEDPGKAVQS